MYQAYFIKTTTGEVGSTIDPTSLSWSIELNKTESFSLTVPKTTLTTIDPTWWEPWSGGALITFTSPDGIERPILAGPIINHPQEDQQTKTLDGAGIRAIFTKRTVWETLPYTNLSYGTIAWELCKHGMEKPGGSLPIYHASPYEKTTRQRTYEGWNLANNIIDKRWEELSNVQAGPDIMLRPEWVPNTNQTRIRWGFHHGTHNNPYIHQPWTPDFDTTAVASDITNLKITSKGAHMANRVWYTGAGEGEGIARVYAQTLTPVQKGQPFLEDIFSDSDQPNPDRLQEKADGALTTKQNMIDQITFDALAHSTKHPLGTYNVGDLCTVTLSNEIAIPDGTHTMRLLAINGTLDPTVTLDFQEAQW